MTRFKKTPIPKDLRKAVFRRDGYVCRYCGSPVKFPHADHVYPESRGGETSYSNLVTACPGCNYWKNAKIGIWPQPLDTIKNVREQVERQPCPIWVQILFCISIGIATMPTPTLELTGYANSIIIVSFTIAVATLCLEIGWSRLK